MSGSELFAALVFLAVATSAALPGIAFRPGDWYRSLRKPSWCPPGWLFGPVWLVLYLSIAASGWIVWREGNAQGPLALTVFGVQLVFNALWPTIFFGLRRPGAACLEIACLWLSIAATIIAFQSISEMAAILLAPYLLWVSFAAALNLRIWQINRVARRD